MILVCHITDRIFGWLSVVGNDACHELADRMDHNSHEHG